MASSVLFIIFTLWEKVSEMFFFSHSCNGRLQKMEEERNTTARECGHLREQLREKEELYLSLESQ